MKTAIVTINDYTNFGNKLQNYAAIKIIKSLNCEVNTLVTNKQNDVIKAHLKLIINKIFFNRLSKTPNIKRRIIRFHKFDKKFLNTSNKYINGKLNPDNYDYFVVGSDQVWNANWFDLDNYRKEAFLLTFARPEQKVCMAPSFGVSELPKKWQAYFKKWLRTFPLLSVREEDGAKIIKDLTGQDAEVVIDPTLMLDSSEWEKIEKAPKIKTDKPYIIKCFLGEESQEQKNYINKIAQDYDYNIIDLSDINSKVYGICGPQEFLYLIHHSELVCTDSFHTTVFSILYNRPFLVFNRHIDGEKNMNSRINTLLTKLNLERKLPDKIHEAEIFENDYSEAFTALNVEREKAYAFLKKSLKINN